MNLDQKINKRAGQDIARRPVDAVVAEYHALQARLAKFPEDGERDWDGMLCALRSCFFDRPRLKLIVDRWRRHRSRAEATSWVAVITDQQSGEELARYELERHDTTDERHWADRYASAGGLEIDDSDGYIPSCGGDIQVAVYDTDRHEIGGVCAWSREQFYFKKEQ